MVSKKGRWIKPRKPLSNYPATEQQKKIREAGKKIGEECAGKKGTEFNICRTEVLEEFFGKKGVSNG